MLNISRGKQIKAQKVIIYGPEGIGKTTFAAQFPDPLFIDTEGSTLSYDLARVDPSPKSWAELVSVVKAVKDDKPCKTLVIDTIDWAEILAIDYICAKNKWTSIETPGWGAGYTHLKEEFGKLLNLLTDLTEVGINVVLTAHAMMRKFDRPDEVSSYDRWELKLQKKVAPIVKEWADAILFVNYSVIVETNDAKKGKARGGKRVMYLEHDPCWDAKNRWHMSGEQEFSYDVIRDHIEIEQPQATFGASKAAFNDAIRNAKPVPEEAPKEEPAQEQAIKQAEAQIEAPSFALPGFWKPLLQLMERDGITLDDIRVFSSEIKDFFSRDTPLEKYPEDYIKGGLIGQWDQVVNLIRDHNDPLPFN